MKRCWYLLLALLPHLAAAQAPRPERIESCVDAVLLTGEHHDFAAIRGGWGGALDWIGCLPRTVYTVGAASFSIADTRWSIAKLGASLQAGSNLWLAADIRAGSGRNSAGDFKHFQLVDAVTLRINAPLFAKLEHQYVRIGPERGHVVKIAAVFLPLRTVAVEGAVARSANATFDTRQASARVDWVHMAGRIYAGGAWGRSIPQAVDLATGLRAPANTTRQWFAGLFHVIDRLELGLLHDLQRSDFSRRRTWTASLKVAFP